MSKKYIITLTIEAEDITDIKQHFSMAREQTLNALKNFKCNPPDRIVYDGMGSSHVVTIKKEED